MLSMLVSFLTSFPPLPYYHSSPTRKYVEESRGRGDWRKGDNEHEDICGRLSASPSSKSMLTIDEIAL